MSVYRKQLLVACLFALLLATGTSAYQFFSDLEQLQDQADLTLHQILLVTSGPLEKLLTKSNIPSATEHLNSLFSFPLVLAIQLVNQQDKELINLNRLPPPSPQTWSEQLFFGATHQHLFQLGNIPEAETTWTIKLDIDNSRVPNNLSRDLIAILLSNFLVCFVLTLTFHSLLHTLFTRQILKLTKQLNRFKGGADKNVQLEVTHFHENDEMGVLAETINELWRSRQELQKNHAAHNKFVTTVRRSHRLGPSVPTPLVS